MNNQNLIVGYIKETIAAAENKYGEFLVKDENAIARFLNLAEFAYNLACDQNAKSIITNISIENECAWFEPRSCLAIRIPDLIFYRSKEHEFFKKVHEADFCVFREDEGDVLVTIGVTGMWVKLSE